MNTETKADHGVTITAMAVGALLLVIAAAVAFELDFTWRVFHYAAAGVLAAEGVALMFAAWLGWDFIVRL